MKETYRTPAQIEKASMEIIDSELERRQIQLPPKEHLVLRRMIHTTADFEFAETVRFSAGAAEEGIRALRAGRVIVTDTNMARIGISSTGLQRLGTKAVCYMADEKIAAAAKERQVTRAVVAMETAAKEYPDAVYAVGNAPTALFVLSEKIRSGLRPSLVIGVPVGFVNVVEAKEELKACCQSFAIPYIIALGRKGGSTVAAAVCNAIIYEALEMTDPGKRQGGR